MATNAMVHEQRAAEDAALEPLGMTVGDRPRRAHRGAQLKLFADQSGWTESARELVRSRPLQAMGIAVLIGLLLGR
jgi:hypothetical protein